MLETCSANTTSLWRNQKKPRDRFHLCTIWYFAGCAHSLRCFYLSCGALLLLNRPILSSRSHTPVLLLLWERTQLIQEVFKVRFVRTQDGVVCSKPAVILPVQIDKERSTTRRM
ncbi:hypothetical protein M758_12G137200 [Ceratodon purpureus]|nr:hypothetical protein M758_12G137200 [Ceratodon purpureus]